MQKQLAFISIVFVTISGAVLAFAHSGHDHTSYPDVKEYAPNFWFDSEEKYYPADPLEFYYDENGEELSGKVAVAEYDKLSLEEKLGKAKVFYKADDFGSEFVYQYWLFYVMNNFKNGHYGDWESVLVFVDKDSKNVSKVVGSAHGSGNKLSNSENNNIWVYVGNGSHANCPVEHKGNICGSSFWENWEKWDGKGRVVASTDFQLIRLEQNYIKSFGERNSFDRDKSPILGVNPLKAIRLSEVSIPFFNTKEEKYYSLPVIGKMAGQTPTFAWAKEEYDNPQKVLVSTPTKIANNIGGFFRNTGNFIAAIGKMVVSPVANLLTAQVGRMATIDVGGSTRADSTGLERAGGEARAETPIIARGQTPPRRGLTPTSSPSTPVEPFPSPDSFVESTAPKEATDGTAEKEGNSTEEVITEPKPRVLIYEPPNNPAPSPQDITAPNAPLVAIANNTTFNSYFDVNSNESGYQINLSGTAEPLSLIAIMNNPTYSATTSPEGSWSKEVTLLQEGANSFSITAQDTAGNTSTSTLFLVNLDSIAPTSTIAKANYNLTSPTFEIQWNTTSTDFSSYDVEFKIGSGIWQDWVTNTTATSKNYLNATTNTYYFRVRGTDIHQNIGPWQESQGVVIDLYQVVINEIQINDAEFVELYNPGSSTTSLAGYYFSYFPSTRNVWNDPFRNKKFPDSASIGGAGYYLIGLKDYATTTGNPKADWQPYSSAQLSNEKGTVGIFPFDPTATTSQYAYDNRVDAIGWGSGISLYEGIAATTTPAAGESLTRNSSHTDTDNNSVDFIVAISTTPTNSTGQTYVPPPPPVSPVWAMYQKDARHSGLATLAGPSWTSSAQATTTWVFAMDSTASSPPVIDGLGVVYAMDGEGKVYAINTDGTQKWKFDPKIQGGNGVGWASASPALSSDGFHIYSTYTDTSVNKLVLYSIKTSDVSLDWKYSPIENGYNQTFTSPVLDESGNIYVASNTKLYSISPSGSLRWAFTPTSQFSSSALWIRTPAIAKEGQNEYAYITAQMSLNGGDKYIFKVDVSNGTEAWHSVDSSINTALQSGVSINATGTIYTGGYLNIGTSGLFAVNPTDGSKIWSNNIGDSLASNIPSYDADGNIFLGTVDTGDIGAIHKTNATGTALWSFWPDSSPSAVQFPSVVDSQGRIYVGAKNKFVYALVPENESIIWKHQLADEPRGFAIGNGRVYVVSYDGKVYAL